MATIELSFKDGFNGYTDLFSLPPGQATQFSDYLLNYGRLATRDDMAVATNSTTLSGAVGVTGWIDSTGSGSRVFVVGDNSHIYRSDTNYSSASSYTFTDITNSVSQPSNYPITWASLNGILVYTGTGMSGTCNKITSLSSNSSALNSGSAVGSVLRTVNNFMFLGGPTALGTSNSGASTFYWSNVGDPTTWSSGNSLTFRNNDGDWISAFGELSGNLIIFKRKSIGMLQTTSLTTSGSVTLGPLTTLFQGIGCLAPTCVDNLSDGRCVFLGSDMNVYILDGTTCTSLTNFPPPGPDITGDYGTGTVTQAAGLRYNPARNEIVWFFTDNNSVTYFYAYDILQRYWRKITGFTIFSMGSISLNNFSYVPKHQSSVLIGTSNNKVFDVNRVNPSIPVDQTGSPVFPVLELSALIPENFFNSGLCSLTIICNGAGGSHLSYQYGFDGTYSSTTTAITSVGRVNVPINMFVNSNSVRPSIFNIKFTTPSSSGIVLYRAYLSSEVNA